jgi:hypothetical protein
MIGYESKELKFVDRYSNISGEEGMVYLVCWQYLNKFINVLLLMLSMCIFKSPMFERPATLYFGRGLLTTVSVSCWFGCDLLLLTHLLNINGASK